mgnify:CR=1 FL=1
MTISSQTRDCLTTALANPTAGNDVKTHLNQVTTNQTNITALQTAQGVGGATFSIGSESSDAIVVGIQLNDPDGDAMTVASAVTILLLADAAGAAFNTDDYTIAAGTDGAIEQLVADKILYAISETDGDIDLSLTISGSATCYVAVVLPNGKLVVSDAVTHAA